MAKEGNFPRPRRLSTRAVGWDATEIETWLRQRKPFKGTAGRRQCGAGELRVVRPRGTLRNSLNRQRLVETNSPF